MKNYLIIIIGSIVIIILVIGLIMFMKPDVIEQPVEQHQKSNYTADSQLNSNNMNGADTNADAKKEYDRNIKSNKNSLNQGEEANIQTDEIDFNEKVYGSTGGVISTNPDLSVNDTAPGSTHLHNPKSDLNIKPIPPESDPANQIFSIEEPQGLPIN